MSLDPDFYTRVSMSGWIFVGVVLAVVWSADPTTWNDLLKIVLESDAGLAAAILGALVGISGPPAFGLIMDRLVSLLLIAFHTNMWGYPAVENFGTAFRQSREKAPGRTADSGSALFHVAFYGSAPQPLLAWARRTRTRVFTTFSAALAAILGLVFAGHPLGLFSPVITLIVAGLVVGFYVYGKRELDHHREAITSWIDNFGPTALTRFSADPATLETTSFPTATTPREPG